MVVIGLPAAVLSPAAIVLGGVILAFLVTAIATPYACRLALRSGWLDVPDDGRKRHERPTPTVGGIAVVAGTAMGLLFLACFQELVPFDLNVLPTPFWLGALAIIITGVYDDIKQVSFKTKLAVQVGVAYLLLHAGFAIEVSNLPFVETDVYNQALISVPLTILWIVGVINAVNLIDGLDGLAGGAALIAITCLGILFGLQGEFGLVLVGLVISGAIIGFLVFNFNPATVFLGDAGSLFLGYTLAVFSLSVKAPTEPVLALIIPVLVLGLPVVDTTFSIVRRIAGRRAICAPDHDHIHHRLQRYFSHRTTVLILYAVSASFGLVAVLASLVEPYVGVALVISLILLSVLGLFGLGYGRERAAEVDSPVRLSRTISYLTVPFKNTDVHGESGDGASLVEGVRKGGDGAEHYGSAEPELEVPRRQVA